MTARRWLSLALMTFFLGCSTTPESVTTDKADAETQDVADGGQDISQQETTGLPETVAPETVDDTIFLPDLSDEDGAPQPACDPGEGCFLDQCQQNSDCLSGWCVEHMGQKVCTLTCQDECPQGWTCNQVGASDPDVVFICVSDFANLCRPCGAASDCAGVAGTKDACVAYGEQGSFCGGKCSNGEECPWGFACQTVTTVDGIELAQCVAETGLCPCTDTAVELGLFTNCEVSNDFGTCQGKRVCTADGLSDCDAPVPAAETCNAVDDNCNGLVDEVDLENGTPVCDDDNACTLDICNGEAGCDHEELSEGECLDGDACTIGDHCEAGICIGQPIKCDDGDVCTDDICDGLGGCTTEFNTAPCDDGDPCTVNDTCSEGSCGGFAVDCECSSDADCQSLEDGDLCNGTLLCDKSKLPHLCIVNPATVVECPAPEAGPDAVCLAAACDPLTGECSLVPDHEGFACEDGNLCTVGDKCVEGVCAAGVGPNCNDGNGCTDDTCDPDIGCLHTDNEASCEDGDPCTEDDTCDQGICAPGAPLVCDDADVCNGTEVCAPGVGCQPGKPLLCNDGDLCNGTETCDPLTGCQEGDALLCDDGNVCNGTETCAPGKGCQAGVALKCDDGDPCNGAENCDPENGCVAGESLVCDDQNVCNGTETCAQGKGCQPGTPLICKDDDDVCTDSVCAPESGCITLLNKAPCDDEDVCTTGDHCELGICISAGSLNCNDNNPCTNDSCDPVNGCVFLPGNDVCDDGNACTIGDHCHQGFCTAGGMLSCNDNNGCTDDSCAPETGCVFTNNAADCNDGNPCTDGDHCQDGSCAPGQDLECDDGQYCNGIESCDEETGCVDGPPPVVDDNVACTLDVCDEENDTVIHAPQNDECNNGAFCDGLETCDAVEGCKDGVPPLLDDGNDCTQDLCDEEADVVVHNAVDPKKYSFSNCSQTGYTGPSQSQCNSVYSGTTLAGQITVAAGIQVWTAPQTGSYDIEAIGAGGGRGKQYNTNVYSNGVPGKGARMSGSFSLNQGDVLHIIVGQKGSEGLSSKQKGGGGGGGSFVVKADGTPLLVAGGGGGSGRYDGNNGDDGVTDQSGTSGNGSNGASGGTNGNGGNVSGCSYAGDSGAGMSGNGKSTCGNGYYARSYTNGGQGGDWSHCWSDGNPGGFGGGGGTGPHGGGGGGGYSGGGGGGDINCGGNGGGGGGGSYNAGANQDNQAGYASGNGSVTIEISCN